MEVLLLSGYRPQPLGLETNPSGELWIDHQIQCLFDLKLTPIVVLAGFHADEIVRQSRLLQNCELVFDANDRQSNLYSNLRAGLHVTEDACFALPIEIPAPPESHWKHLKAQLVQQGLLTANHVLQLEPKKGAAWHQTAFPFLITAVGNRVIKNLKNGTGLTDERIQYHRMLPLELATPA